MIYRIFLLKVEREDLKIALYRKVVHYIINMWISVLL